MRPSTLRQGERITYHGYTESFQAVFIKRIPAKGKGCPAVNFIRIPAFAGLNGADDDGTCQISDYDLARRGERHAN